MRLWKRDTHILFELERTILSITQIAKLFFPKKKKASERMTLLHRAGFVSRFHTPYIEERGRPEYIYCKKGRRPKSYGWIRHQLLITDFRLWLKKIIPQDLKLEFFYSSELHNRISGGLFVPDGCFIVSNEDKDLLCFLEIDRSTEPLKGKHYAFKDKIALYEHYFDSQNYQKDFSEHQFKGFRLICLFNSRSRLTRLGETDQFIIPLCWEDLKEGIKQGIKMGIISPQNEENKLIASTRNINESGGS